MPHKYDASLRELVAAFIQQGRTRKVHKEAEEAVKDLLIENPTAYQEEFEICCHRSTVSWLLHRLKLTHKVLRACWHSKTTELSASQVIVVDESAANEDRLVSDRSSM